MIIKYVRKYSVKNLLLVEDSAQDVSKKSISKGFIKDLSTYVNRVGNNNSILG